MGSKGAKTYGIRTHVVERRMAYGWEFRLMLDETMVAVGKGHTWREARQRLREMRKSL